MFQRNIRHQTDILRILEDKIKAGFANCRFDGVRAAEEARRSMMLASYHLVIADERSFNKIARAGSSPIRNFPLLVLTDNGQLHADQKNSFAPNVYGYLSADRLEKIIPILSRLLNIEFTQRWQRPFKLYGGIFNLGTVEAAEKIVQKRRDEDFLNKPQ